MSSTTPHVAALPKTVGVLSGAAGGTRCGTPRAVLRLSSSDKHKVSAFSSTKSVENLPQILLHQTLTFAQRCGIPTWAIPHAYLRLPLRDWKFDESCTDILQEIVYSRTNHRRNQSDLALELEEGRSWLSTKHFHELATETFPELGRRYSCLGSFRGLSMPPIIKHMPFHVIQSGNPADTVSDSNSEEHLYDRVPIHSAPITDKAFQRARSELPIHSPPNRTASRLQNHDASRRTQDNALLTSMENFSFLPDMSEEESDDEPEEENILGPSIVQKTEGKTLRRDGIPTNRDIQSPVSVSDATEPFSIYSKLCLDSQITPQIKYVVASGGYADVWTGSFHGHPVAIKVMRPFNTLGKPIQKARILKRLWREYLTWSSLSHPNILECLGFSYDFTPASKYEVPSLISPWMTNGTVPSYIQKYPHVDRLKLVVGIAKGLSYLHNRNPAIVHGDLRAGNILVRHAGDPCLTDFGLSRILGDNGGMTTSSEAAGSLRWMSPDLLHGDKASESSDVWAYGMTLLEILSGKRPYQDFNLEPVVLRQILEGRVPSRPLAVQGAAVWALTDEVWAICQKCWHIQPMQRPSMREVTLDLMAEHRRQRFREYRQHAP